MATEFDILIAAAGNAEAIKQQVELSLISVSADKSTDNLKLIEDLSRTLVALGQLCRDVDSLLVLSARRQERPESKAPVTLDIKSTIQIKPAPPVAPAFKPSPKGRRFRQLSTKEDWHELVAAMMPIHGHLPFEEFLKKVRSEAMVYGFESPMVADDLLHNMVIGPHRELKKSYRPRNGSEAWSHTFDPKHEPVLVDNPGGRQCLVCGATLNAYNHGKFCSAHTKKP